MGTVPQRFTKLIIGITMTLMLIIKHTIMLMLITMFTMMLTLIIMFTMMLKLIIMFTMMLTLIIRFTTPIITLNSSKSGYKNTGPPSVSLVAYDYALGDETDDTKRDHNLNVKI